jgi:hypothetical protein
MKAARLLVPAPGAFGSLRLVAALPQSDVVASVAEVERLGTDAVMLLSNVDDVHFGDRQLEPLWSVLDERRAVVYVHPNGRPGTEDAGPVNPLYLWQNDTARTMLDFLRAGGHVRYPEIRWVLSHAGGPLPVVLERALRNLLSERADILAFGGPGQVTFSSDFPCVRRSAGQIVGRA